MSYSKVPNIENKIDLPVLLWIALLGRIDYMHDVS